jgi:hydrogenase large subunit
MSRRVVGPFNRVEGDLEVQLEIGEGQVSDAWVVSPLYRGFEAILHGKDPRDALVYTPRICGICSVSQSVAAAAALADAQGLAMPRNGELAVNLVLANENVADHLTHFYLFFMPDFARGIYSDEAWYPLVHRRFLAVSGSAVKQVLPARADWLHLMGLLAGKWPHSLSLQPGGSTRAVEVQEQVRILAIIYAFRQFLESTLFGDTLENILALSSAAELDQWLDRRAPESSDFSLFLHVARALELEGMGRASDTFMSYGVYPDDGQPLFGRGTWREGEHPLRADSITEDLSHSWMAGGEHALHPYEGVTRPDADAADGYTWCKAPRLGGQVVEVGALARQVVDGNPLVRSLVQESGGNVRNRIVARLLEIARVVEAMHHWARELRPGESFCAHAAIPREAQGCGMIEAARGSLGHWLQIRNGRIHNYQIIAPTTWNFSPRDSGGTAGALEQALRGAPVRAGEKDPVSVQHIVRSFDPCMVCTVH